MDVSQPLSSSDGNSAFNIEQTEQIKKGYIRDFFQSFNLVYLKHKWFDEKRKYI